jgi:plasmid stabilization system protein ParE
MDLEIFWSKRADNKFDKILDYLSAEWGERVTSAFVKKDSFSSLDRFSQLMSRNSIVKDIEVKWDNY